LLAHPGCLNAHPEFRNPPSTRPGTSTDYPFMPGNHLNVRSKNIRRSTARPGVPSIHRHPHICPLLTAGKPGLRHYPAVNVLNDQEIGNISDEVIVNRQPQNKLTTNK
jgi:hypothetical protein